MSTPTAGRPARRLGPGLTAFLVVDVILVLAFLVVLGTTLAGRDGGEPAAAPQPTASSPEPETSPDETPDADAEEVGEVRAFVLPSGNIHCAMDDGSATCTILSFSYERPAPPEGCTGQAGNVLTVDASGSTGFVCQEGEPAAAPAGTPVLDYGEQTTVGAMTCASSTNGVLCRHNESGAGFSVARAGYLFF